MDAVFVDFVHPDVVVLISYLHHQRIIRVRLIVRIQTISRTDRHQATLTVRTLVCANLRQLTLRT